MLRNDQTVCGEIQAMIALVIRGVAKEDTRGGLRGELVGHCGSSVRVTRAAEEAQMLVRWCKAKEVELWTGSLNYHDQKMVQ
jgi:hypothetical protein